MLCPLIYSILGTSGLNVQVLAMAREHCETLEMTLFSDCVGGSKAVVLTWILITHCVYSNTHTVYTVIGTLYIQQHILYLQ